MITKQQLEDMRKVSNYTDQLLDIVDNWEEFTRSDLQGVLEALVRNIINNERQSWTTIKK